MPKKKIAILGGGIGALSAAFMITQERKWEEKYEITVYQMGWRLGGKGANGRNADHHDRIEEHGLHVWFGFYENAFWLLRQCYDSLGADWRNFFAPQDWITPMENLPEGWIPWEIYFPPNRQLPGNEKPFPSLWEYMLKLLHWSSRFCAESELTPIEALGSLKDAVSYAFQLPLNVMLHHNRDYQRIIRGLNRFEFMLYQTISQQLTISHFVRRFWIIVNLAISVARGMLKDKVVRLGFDSIDKFDLRQWLLLHGADPQSADSAPIRAIYDGVFAYEKGDPQSPNLAAGTGLRGAIRLLFSYKGHFVWKMLAGMGEAVFTPIYQVLKDRGVKFEFFHRIDNLSLSRNGTSIDAIDITIQATIKNGRPYRPLRRVNGLYCWPTTPFFDQLDQGDALKDPRNNLESHWTCWPGVAQKKLCRGQDFDVAVLGIPIAPLKWICKELLRASPEWRNMVRYVQTTQTIGLQLWLKRDTRGLGWAGRLPALLSGYVEPLDTWGDMSALIPCESWPASAGVRSIAYFCGPFPDADKIPDPGCNPDFPRDEHARAKAIARYFLQTAIQPLWPCGTLSTNPNCLDWSLLVAPSNQVGAQRLQSQFWIANIDPSARYSLSVKGSTPFRLRGEKSLFDNLFLAGDWTYNGMNAGCVEAAVMSGMQAARGIVGSHRKIIGETDF